MDENMSVRLTEFETYVSKKKIELQKIEKIYEKRNK